MKGLILICAGLIAAGLAYATNWVALIVNPSKRQTHPHLYDRLLAAGVEPDYPRPAAPETIATHGGSLAGLLGILAVLNFMRLFH